MGQPYWCISGHAGDRITTARAATGTYVRVDIYYSMSPDDKFLVWLSGDVKTPPFSAEARLEAGFLLRRLHFVDADAVVILHVFKKKTRATPNTVIEVCQRRLRAYRSTRSQ
jgi:hypothetical protein